MGPRRTPSAALTLLLLCVAPADGAAATPVALRNSTYHCLIEDGQAGGALGRLVRGTFRRFGGTKRKRATRKIAKRARKARRATARADRRRLDARGTPGFDAAYMAYVQAYRAEGALETLRAEIAACQRGERAGIDDVADPLVPAEKRPWDPEAGYQPTPDRTETGTEAFAYDEAAYHVTRTALHGVTVVVAIHRQAPDVARPPFTPEDFAAAVTDQVHEAMHVNGGFAVDRFVFKVRAPGESAGFALCDGGVVLSADDYGTLQQAHEPFHSWNGHVYRPVPDGTDNLFQLLTWVMEELTVYYSYVIESHVVDPGVQVDYLEYAWEEYLRYRGDPQYDLPYADLAARASEFGTDGSIYRSMMNYRGVLAAHAIEQGLAERGLTLDVLMQELYRRGLAGQAYSLDDVKAILLAASGRSFADVIDGYIVANGDFTVLFGDTPTFTDPRLRLGSGRKASVRRLVTRASAVPRPAKPARHNAARPRDAAP